MTNTSRTPITSDERAAMRALADHLDRHYAEVETTEAADSIRRLLDALDTAEGELAVVRRNAPVRPDRAAVIERVAERWWALSTPDLPWSALTPDERARVIKNANIAPLTDAVLAEWPGETRARVREAALREAADAVFDTALDADVARWLTDLAAEGGDGR